MLFLPGERDYVNSKTGGDFRNGDQHSFFVGGDCAYLNTEHVCIAGIYKPFECLSFPLVVEIVEGRVIPTFAKNCTYHPRDLHPRWISDRLKAWEYIYEIIPGWVEEIYCPSPDHMEE